MDSSNSSAGFAKDEPTRTEIDALSEPVVLEFGTPWCTHCQAAQPFIAEAFSHHLQIKHIKIEDGAGRPLGRSFRVKLWPTLIFMRNGKEVERLVRPANSGLIEEAIARIDAVG